MVRQHPVHYNFMFKVAWNKANLYYQLYPHAKFDVSLWRHFWDTVKKQKNI